MPTILGFVNRSEEVRSRTQPCSGGNRTIGIRRAGDVPPSQLPTCAPIPCEALAPGEVVQPQLTCTNLSCADTRIDIAPGSSDVDYLWDGVYRQLTDRNCWQRVALEPDVPMVAQVCFGAPGENDWAIAGYHCELHEFGYGVERTEFGLR